MPTLACEMAASRRDVDWLESKLWLKQHPQQLSHLRALEPGPAWPPPGDSFLLVAGTVLSALAWVGLLAYAAYRVF